MNPDGQTSLADDEDLVRAFIDGKNGVFDQLVHRHQDRVYRLCYGFLGDCHEADDAAQEVFIKAHRALPRFRFEARFSTWLHRIAVNTCKNRMKSLSYRFKKWTDRLEAGDPFPADSLINGGAGRSNPDRVLENKERGKRIWKEINGLGEEQKTMVLLRDVEGLSYAEINTPALSTPSPLTAKSRPPTGAPYPPTATHFNYPYRSTSIKADIVD